MALLLPRTNTHLSARQCATLLVNLLDMLEHAGIYWSILNITEMHPSRIGLRGNEIADKSATAGHEHISLTSVPFTKFHVANLVRRLGREVHRVREESPISLENASRYWPAYLKFRTHLSIIWEKTKMSACLKMETCYLTVSRQLEATTHGLRLNLAFTKYLHKIDMVDSCSSFPFLLL